MSFLLPFPAHRACASAGPDVRPRQAGGPRHHLQPGQGPWSPLLRPVALCLCWRLLLPGPVSLLDGHRQGRATTEGRAQGLAALRRYVVKGRAGEKRAGSTKGGGARLLGAGPAPGPSLLGLWLPSSLLSSQGGGAPAGEPRGPLQPGWVKTGLARTEGCRGRSGRAQSRLQLGGLRAAGRFAINVPGTNLAHGHFYH